MVVVLAILPVAGKVPPTCPEIVGDPGCQALLAPSEIVVLKAVKAVPGCPLLTVPVKLPPKV